MTFSCNSCGQYYTSTHSLNRYIINSNCGASISRARNRSHSRSRGVRSCSRSITPRRVHSCLRCSQLESEIQFLRNTVTRLLNINHNLSTIREGVSSVVCPDSVPVVGGASGPDEAQTNFSLSSTIPDNNILNFDDIFNS